MNEETKESIEDVRVEMVEAYQIKARNVYLPENEFEAITLEIPPAEILIKAMKENHIQLKWEGDDNRAIPSGPKAVDYKPLPYVGKNAAGK